MIDRRAARLWAAFMESDDMSLSADDELWALLTDREAVDDLDELCGECGLVLRSGRDRAWLLPTGPESPFLAGSRPLSEAFRSADARASAAHRRLLAFVTMTFLALFYDPGTSDGRTSREFVTADTLVREVGDRLLRPAHDACCAAAYEECSRLWNALQERGDDDRQAGKGNAYSRRGVVNYALGFLRSNGLAEASEDSWRPTDKMTLMAPVVLSSDQVDRVISCIEGGDEDA